MTKKDLNKEEVQPIETVEEIVEEIEEEIKEEIVEEIKEEIVEEVKPQVEESVKKTPKSPKTMTAPKDDKVVVKPMVYEEIIDDEDSEGEKSNLDVIMSIPLEITIEIGRTKRQIKDIMGFRSGSVIDLDKQVGDLVDLVVNGQLIAKGEVVVVNDNYGIRVVEIVKTEDLLKLTL